MELNKSNYFGREAAQAYMSVSQVKAFMKCEASALAEINQEHSRDKTPALIIGGLVDAYFSMEEQEYALNNPELFKRDGTLKAEYQQVYTIIDRILASPLLKVMLRGEVQRIVTGEIAGVPFRGKIDSLLSPTACEWIADEFPDMAELVTHTEMDEHGDMKRIGTGAIVDLKIMRDMEPIWTPDLGRVSFVNAWKYDLQLAVYQRLAGGKLPTFIVCATKQDPPDIELIHVPQYALDLALSQVTPMLARYAAIKAGEVEPKRCEKCDYCRGTKTVTGAISMDDLEGAI